MPSNGRTTAGQEFAGQTKLQYTINYYNCLVPVE